MGDNGAASCLADHVSVDGAVVAVRDVLARPSTRSRYVLCVVASVTPCVVVHTVHVVMVGTL